MKRIFGAKLIFLVFLGGLSLSFTGCEDGVGSINIFSIQDDVQLGEQLDEEIRSNPQQFPMLNNPAANAYVQGILDEVILSPEIEYREEFEYKVQIIDDQTVNAFAAPGGYIYVYTGLLKQLDNKATLAAILGHEAAHCEERHATTRMTQQYGISVLLSVILGQDPGTLEQIAANLFSGLTLMHNSRDDEYESDEKSVIYLRSTKYYPAAAKFFFEKMQEHSNSSDFEELFSTHPLDEKRGRAN
jgi:predicted Zn-dependent protease